MTLRSVLRAAAIALTALLGAGLSAAHADSGSISLRIYKAGFVIGGSAGSGVLNYHGHSYPLSIGGLSYGFTFGASETRFHGTVTNIRSPRDVEGVYGAAGAGATVIRGPQAIVLANQKGATLEVSGRQTGLMINLDLSGMALSLK